MPGRVARLASVLVLLAVWLPAVATEKVVRKKVEPTTGDLPLESLDSGHRKLVEAVLQQPTLAARGPQETFHAQPEHYLFFLDHPDRAVTAWKRLGAKCVAIEPRGEGKFFWRDDQGSAVDWVTCHRDGSMRLWYAEGQVRPGPLLPLVPVKALVVLRHQQVLKPDGDRLLRQQADIFLRTESKTAAMVARMLGPSSHRLAEQGLGQLQLFFSGLAWYLDRHPDEVEKLLRPEEPETPEPK